MIWHRQDIQTEEFIERLIYSLCAPIVRLGRAGGLSLKDVERLLRIAYFRTLKEEGLSNKDIAQVMQVSSATVARLASETRENFLRPDREHRLPVRIAFMLWAEPMSRAKIAQVLGGEVTDEALDSALEEMVEQDRVALREDRYVLVKPADRLVRPDWVSRIGALNILLDNLSEVVHERFLYREQVEDADERGFARTLIFNIAREDRHKLKTLYELVVWPALVALDGQAKKKKERGDEVSNAKLTYFWAVSQENEDNTP